MSPCSAPCRSRTRAVARSARSAPPATAERGRCEGSAAPLPPRASCRQPLRVGALELDAEARPRVVGAQRAALRRQRPVEEHRLETRVIMEELEVHGLLAGAQGLRVYGR